MGNFKPPVVFAEGVSATHTPVDRMNVENISLPQLRCGR